MHFGPVEVEEEIAGYSGQLESLDRNYKEHFASHPSDGKFDQIDENVVDREPRLWLT